MSRSRIEDLRRRGAWAEYYRELRRGGVFDDLLEPIRPPAACDDAEVFDEALAAEARRRLELYDRAAADARLAALLNERGRHDPVWWVNTFIWGLDPRRPRLRKHPVVLFPQQEPLLHAVLGPSAIALDASRDTGKTVTTLSAGLHETRYNDDTQWGLTSKTGGEVDDGGEWQSLFGMLRFMLRHIPEWARPQFRAVRSPRPLIELSNGSAFKGAMATPTAFHGPRLRRIVVDEAARVRRLGDVMTGVLGATDAPMLISTPRGRTGYFASVVHGEVSPIRRWSPGIRLEPGEWLHLRMHYSDDPRRDDAWRAKKMAEVGDPVIWAQQYEIDYTASVPGRIWPEYQESLHLLSEEEFAGCQRADWWPSEGIIEAWDPGLKAAVVWLMPVDDVAFVLDYRMWLDTPLERILSDARQVPWHRQASVRVIDPAARQRNAVDLRSWRSEFRRAGLPLRTPNTTNTRDLRENVRRALVEEGLLFSPLCARRHNRDLPSLIEAVTNYRRDLRGVDSLADHISRGGQAEPPPLKDIHSHLADALQYGVDFACPPTGRGPLVRKGGRWVPTSEYDA